MGKLPILSGEDLVLLLEKSGFLADNTASQPAQPPGDRGDDEQGQGWKTQHKQRRRLVWRVERGCQESLSGEVVA